MSISHRCYAAALNTRDTLFSRAAFDLEKTQFTLLKPVSQPQLLNISKQHERRLKSAEVFSSTYGEEYRRGPCKRYLHGLTFTCARKGESSQIWSMERERERETCTAACLLLPTSDRMLLTHSLTWARSNASLQKLQWSLKWLKLQTQFQGGWLMQTCRIKGYQRSRSWSS